MPLRSFRKYHPISFALLLVGLLASASVLVARHRAESQNRAVELAIDFVQLRQLGYAMGVPPAAALERLAGAGVTGVILTEETPADLESEAALDVRPASLRGAGSARVTVTRVHIEDPALYVRIRAAMTNKLRTPFSDTPTAGGLLLESPTERAYFPGHWTDIRGMGVGLNPGHVAMAKAAHLDVVARVANFPAASPQSIDGVLRQVAAAGGRLVIFTGEEVLGFRKQLKTTAEALERNGLVFGAVELGKQRGNEGISAALHARFVRVHSIPTAELARLTPNDAIERFSKAVRERNIRLAYLRLFDEAGADPMAENVTYISELVGDLRAGGFEMGPARPFASMTPLPAASAFAALAVAGAAVLLAAAVAPISRSRQAVGAVLLAAACFGVVFVAGDLGRKLIALGAAVLFPTLGFLLLPVPLESGLSDAEERPAPIWAWFALISALSVAGGVVLAGVLSQTASLVKVVEFSGIKVAQVIPLFLVGAIYVAGAFNTGDWLQERRRIVERVRRLLCQPILTWHSAAALIGLVALALLVARSGNDPGVGVSDLELRFRSLLDRFLVRPRTKEFLIGHPVLWCVLFLVARRIRGGWLLPIMLVGAIGQVGMVNSFCHLHTPIAITLARTWNGLWIGSLVGLVAIALIRRLIPGKKPRKATRRDEEGLTPYPLLRTPGSKVS